MERLKKWLSVLPHPVRWVLTMVIGFALLILGLIVAESVENHFEELDMTELAGKLRSFADQLQTVGMYQLLEVTNSDAAQAGRLAEVRAASVDLSKLCQ